MFAATERRRIYGSSTFNLPAAALVLSNTALLTFVLQLPIVLHNVVLPIKGAIALLLIGASLPYVTARVRTRVRAPSKATAIPKTFLSFL